MDESSFRFEYAPGTIRYGRECVDALAEELERAGVGRALVVCGNTVGTTPDVIDPVVAGLGDALVDVFARTSPQTRLDTAVEAAELAREEDVDVLVSLGGGSSLDLAKIVATLVGSARSHAEAVDEVAERGGLSVPEDPLPIVAVPTTLAGADLSIGAGVSVAADDPENETGERLGGGVWSPALMPTALFYDPALFETTPQSVLAASAMNGFDKGIESLYARNATPLTDATAVRGLRLLGDGLPALGRGARDEATLRKAITGTVLVQYGISRVDGTTMSLVHAFGHGLRDHAGLQQGAAHAIVAPHALAYLFEHVDGRRDLLAEAFDVPRDDRTPTAVATAVVDAVTDVRDALDLPTQLRDVDGCDRDELPAIAETTLEDSFMRNVPAELDPSREDLQAVLDAAW